MQTPTVLLFLSHITCSSWRLLT